MSAYDDDEGGEGYEDVDEEAEKKSVTEALLPPPAPESTKGPPSEHSTVAPSTAAAPAAASSPPISALNCSCFLWSFIWFIILVAFAWPFSVAMAALYGFVSPMISLMGLEDISESMLQAVHVGRECARNVRVGRPIV